MVVPSTTHCDFCGNELKPGQHVVQIKLPIPSGLRRELIAFVERDMQARPHTSPLHGMMSPDHMVPHAWTLESCAPCAFGILPGAREKVVGQIRERMRAHIDAKRRSEEASRELDEAAVEP